jgi:hypothetical protein
MMKNWRFITYFGFRVVNLLHIFASSTSMTMTVMIMLIMAMMTIPSYVVFLGQLIVSQSNEKFCVIEPLKFIAAMPKAHR